MYISSCLSISAPEQTNMISVMFPTFLLPCIHLQMKKKTLIPKSCQLTLAKVSIKKSDFYHFIRPTRPTQAHTHTERQRHVYNGMLSQLPLLCRLTFQHSGACYVLVWVWNAIRFCECEKGNKIYQFPYFFFSCLRVKCLPRTRYVACTVQRHCVFLWTKN